jgi:ribosomal protein S18 acetylase RimI-like enzyme
MRIPLVMTVSTRRATDADVPFLAEVVLLASRSHLARGVWDHMLPDDAPRRRFLERLLVTGKGSWCHWTKFRVAEVGGVPAAALSAYAEDEPGMIVEDDAIVQALDAIGVGAPERAAMFERLAPFLTCLMPAIGMPWIVEWVATLPTFRRRGLTDVLLREVLDEGRKAGRGRAQIMVIAGNVTAQRAYERVGFVVHETRSTPEFTAMMGTQGLVRLSQRLVG